MKRQAILTIILVLFFLFPVFAYGHAGHTDSNGGHYDYDSGKYHYHHGYPAHSHSNGKCPYDYDDRTGEGSGSSSGISSYWWKYTVAPRPTASPTLRPTATPSTIRPTAAPTKPPKEQSFIQKHPVLTTIFAIAAFFFISCYISSKREKAREQERLAKLAEEKRKATEFYSTHDLRTLCHIPEIYYLDEKNVPYEYNKPKEYSYGATLDVYISYGSSDVYHRKECRYASYRFPKNVFSDDHSYHFQNRRPCSICNPPHLPDANWYLEYLHHISECKRHGITPKIDPDDYAPPAPPEPEPVPAPPPIPTPAPSALPDPFPAPVYHLLYKSKYPKTWSYINKNAKNAESYVNYYHFVWGKLQEQHGDGIIYGTLTDDEQALIQYPPLGKCAYLSSETSDTYHSTPNCYSLLKSAPIVVDATQTVIRKRCTKCVAPHSET